MVAIETDPTTPVGMMRLLATDVDPAAPLLTDEQYLALLALEAGNTKRGAAAALETIATSEVLCAKKVTSEGLSTDGPAVGEALAKRAAELRAQADIEDPAGADEDAAFGLLVVDYPAHRWW